MSCSHQLDQTALKNRKWRKIAMATFFGTDFSQTPEIFEIDNPKAGKIDKKGKKHPETYFHENPNWGL